MPVEYALLKDRPEALARCPASNAKPFYALMRGMVHSTWRKYVPAFEPKNSFPGFRLVPRPYCSVICSQCKEIVGYEKP